MNVTKINQISRFQGLDAPHLFERVQCTENIFKIYQMKKNLNCMRIVGIHAIGSVRASHSFLPVGIKMLLTLLGLLKFADPRDA